MKTNQTLVSCYEDFLSLCSTFRIPAGNYDPGEILIFEKPGIFDHLPFGSCLIDYYSRQYLYLSHNSEEILSYSKEDYESGLIFHYNKMLPEDRTIFNNYLFPDILQFLSGIPQSEYENYRFSFNHRFYRKDGCILNILQHSTYLEPEPNGLPLLNRAIFSDITPYKKDGWMMLNVSYMSRDKGYIPILKKRYNPYAKNCITNRELEILRLSQQGLSSKLIADKLYLSIHTVKNHKRSMMEKTSSNNICELINYAVRNKIL